MISPRFLVLSMICTGFLGCASMKVKDHVDEVQLEGSAHTEWWNDSVPRVLMLPRVCDGVRPVFQVPGPVPSVYLELDWKGNVAKFHDIAPACMDSAKRTDSLRIVVSRWKIALEGTDSVQLDGRFSDKDRDEEWYKLGTLEKQDAADAANGGGDNRYQCAYGALCLHEGANIRWRSDTGIVTLDVVERLHPGLAPWAIRERRVRSMGYLVSVPIDILLSPLYLVGGVILYVGLRDFNPWH